MISAAETPARLDPLWSLVPGSGSAPPVEIVPPSQPPATGYQLSDIAGSSVAAATAAALAAGRDRGVAAGDDQPRSIATDHILADWRGHVRIDGRAVPAWAELSGHYRTGDDRFIQLHCNFPHHAEGVTRLLNVPPDRERVSAAVARVGAFELEEALRVIGLIGAAYRTPAEWDEHPHRARRPTGSPRRDTHRRCRPPALASPDPGSSPVGDPGARLLAGAGRPGLRPNAGRPRGPGPPRWSQPPTVGSHGRHRDRVRQAERLGRPRPTRGPGPVHHPGPGGRHRRRRLPAGSPGRPGLRPRGLGRAAPGNRRRPDQRLRLGRTVGRSSGYDSIVQSTTGIALGQAGVQGSAEPVHLPVQALDFATGYLAAFAAARLLSHQRTAGGSWLARLSLLRTRNWLVGRGGPIPFEPSAAPDIGPYLHTVDSDFGLVEAITPVAGRWDLAPTRLGTAQPVWL